jgi:hypothetical protein
MRHILTLIFILSTTFIVARINENLEQLTNRYGTPTTFENEVYGFIFKDFTIKVAIHEGKAVALTFLKDDGESVITDEEIKYLLESNLGKGYNKGNPIGTMQNYDNGNLSASYVPELSVLVIMNTKKFDEYQKKITIEKMDGF